MTLRGTLRVAAVALLSLPLAGCFGILDPKGPVGDAQRLILFNSLAIMLAIVIPVIVLTIAFGWWYRASNTKAEYLPDWAYSGRVELVVWAIPALVVLFLAGIAWIGSHDLDPARELDSPREPMEIQVVSLDWKWLFIYPTQNVASVNDLILPQGQPVRFRLTSGTVLNTFFVPQLGSMIYTMNGMETKLHLQADQPGTFEGLSAHYSGEGFSDMRFLVHSVDKPTFDAWVGKAQGAGNKLDDAAYADLIKESVDVKPFTYGGVKFGLFNSIVRQTAPEAPGPLPGPAGSGQSSQGQG